VSETVADVRAFNRWWSRAIGLLGAGINETRWSLTEARVLFELSRGPETEVAALRAELGLDPGYLSRILARFRAQRLITMAAGRDARTRQVRLTPRGRVVFAGLDANTARAVAALLADLDGAARRRLVGAMTTIRQLLASPARPAAWQLRPPAPGELGWVVERHGAYYAAAHGWDHRFESLVARIAADFLSDPDPRRQRAWIAELEGGPVGSILCARRNDSTAQLRLLLTEPRARGLGIGARLIDECVRFARGAGYRTIILSTCSVLHAARRLYQRAGFSLTDERPQPHFGTGLIEQIWSLPLTPPRSPSPRRPSR
jgi:DNA-binding MarR family transcriptional regulator/GNAT superfamily N-acetyltransferase